jgi:hypothetical protein
MQRQYGQRHTASATTNRKPRQYLGEEQLELDYQTCKVGSLTLVGSAHLDMLVLTDSLSARIPLR